MCIVGHPYDVKSYYNKWMTLSLRNEFKYIYICRNGQTNQYGKMGHHIMHYGKLHHSGLSKTEVQKWGICFESFHVDLNSTNDITAGDIALYAAMCWANWNSIPSATGAFNIYSWTGDDFPFLQDGLCQPPWNILKPDLQVLLFSDSELLPAPSLVPPPSPRPLVEHVRLQREGADGLYNF
jgi:hypothetical protein